MKPQASDHFHHYTYGETDEPDVTQQLAPVWEHLYAVVADVRDLRDEVAKLKRQLAALETAAA